MSEGRWMLEPGGEGRSCCGRPSCLPGLLPLQTAVFRHQKLAGLFSTPGLSWPRLEEGRGEDRARRAWLGGSHAVRRSWRCTCLCPAQGMSVGRWTGSWPCPETAVAARPALGAATRFGQSHPFPEGGAGEAARPLRADLKCPSGVRRCAALRNGSAFSLAFYGSCKWRNDPTAGPDFPLAACVQANMNRWVRIHKMRKGSLDASPCRDLRKPESCGLIPDGALLLLREGGSSRASRGACRGGFGSAGGRSEGQAPARCCAEPVSSLLSPPGLLLLNSGQKQAGVGRAHGLGRGDVAMLWAGS
ncbi:uncharacterized protein FN964_009995 isoform 2-T2 [Alca torda]